jgi:phosphoserine phosphatase
MSTKQSLVPNWLIGQCNNNYSEAIIVIAGKPLESKDIVFVKDKLNGCGIEQKVFAATHDARAIDIQVSISSQQALSFFSEIETTDFLKHCDIALFPNKDRRKKLLVCDMDSTIVETETLDEIAVQAGIGEQVSGITEKTMRGEIDFEAALSERVKLLAGMPVSLLSDIAKQTRFNQGAERLILLAKENGIRTVLVSGGFEPIVNTVAEKLGFDRYVCNKMEISNELLSGKVEYPIVDSSTKLSVLLEECNHLNINPEQACAIGDGANDLPMIEAAGLGISYYGKPVLRNATSSQINATDLESALFYMGMFN